MLLESVSIIRAIVCSVTVNYCFTYIMLFLIGE